MELDERVITRAIVDRWHQKFRDCLDVDVCIVQVLFTTSDRTIGDAVNGVHRDIVSQVGKVFEEHTAVDRIL